MNDWAGKIMKGIEDGVREKARQVIEDRLKPLKTEIRREGAKVKIVPQANIESPFKVTIDASEELTAKIKKALSNK